MRNAMRTVSRGTKSGDICRFPNSRHRQPKQGLVIRSSPSTIADPLCTTLSEHHKVLHRLHMNDFCIQLRKCLFRLPKLPFLSHIVSAEGISQNLQNVQAIKEAPVPTCLSELKSFMGMVTFYTTFLPKLVTVAEPLHALDHADTQFAWSSECQVAFNAIKDSISTHMQLALFDPCCSTHLNTDASGVGLGATLTQLQAAKR